MSAERPRGRRRDPEQTGPVTPDVISGAWSHGLADAGTGPLPAAGGPGSPASDAASVTAPHAVPGRQWGGRPAPVPPPRRPGRRASRDERVVAFVLNQFPLGHMPVAATSPGRQLPVPEDGEPRTHPRSAVVSEAGWPERVRAGAARVCPRAQGESVPAAVTEGYRWHGEFSELEWERTFRAQGDTAWPGSEPPVDPVVLPPETIVDHFGDGFGRLLAPVGTPFAQRGMPPEALTRYYRRFRVLRPVPVWSAAAAPWFAQPGGGLRYRTTCPVVELIALGHLLELTGEPETLRLTPEALCPSPETLRLSKDGPGEDER